MTTVAETIAQVLCESGIDIVFGLPGGETVELLDELRRHDIEFLLVRNESSAVFMADAYARITGKPAVCMTTLGPGATNAVMGVAHCHLDRSPVIIITAQKPDALLDGYTHQVIDLQALYQPITKASVKVNSGNVRQAVLHALAIAAAGRPGPVHLQLSAEDAASNVVDLTETQSATAVQLPLPDAADIERATSLLAGALRPLILVGLGIEPQSPYAALQTLAETVNAPVISTPKAKGALPDNHPLAAGTIGLTRTDPVYELIEEADCIIAVGFDVVELVKPWDFSGSLVWIAPWENEDPTIRADCEIVGDMAYSLTAIACAETATVQTWGSPRVEKLHRDSMMLTPSALPGRISPQVALRIMRDCATADTFLSVDVGSHKIFSSLAWPSLAPNRFLVSNGLSSMGFALPSAIGAAEASPDSQVMCLTGDAGLAMNVGELGLLVQRELPVVVIVFNDGAIDLIRSHQRRAGKPVFGTEFIPPRHDQIASAFGLSAHRVDNEDAFAKVLSESLASRKPALIEVMLDPAGYPTTPRASH